MDRFKAHYLGLSVPSREVLAKRAGTTKGTLNQIVYGGKRVELGLADCLVALCPGLTLSDIPLTVRAVQQHQVRSLSALPTTQLNASSELVFAETAVKGT